MNEKQATLSSKLVLLSILFVASLLSSTTLALIVVGGAKPFVLLDPGELVRWGLPMARAIMNVAMATAIGALVVAAFVFAEASKQLRTVMNIAAVASIVWVLAGLLSLNFTYLNITGTAFTLEQNQGAGFWQFVTQIGLGQYLALNLAGGVLVSKMSVHATWRWRAPSTNGTTASSALRRRRKESPVIGSPWSPFSSI